MMPAAWRDLAPLFTPEEFTCRCGCGRGPEEMDETFMNSLYSLRVMAQIVFPVGSGFRCPTYNRQVSTTGGEGPHTTGHAVDLELFGEGVYRVLELALDKSMFSFTGIGLNQRGAHGKRFIHLDDLPNAEARPRPWIWTY